MTLRKRGIRGPTRSVEGAPSFQTRTPLLHQERALDWTAGRDDVVLFMEMRLGKSLVVTRWAKSLGAERVLILAPLSTLADWKDELAAEGERGIILSGDRQTRFNDAKSQDGWFLLNYEGLVARSQNPHSKTIVAPIAALPWDVVIADESTRIRNPKSKTTRACLTKFWRTDHHAVLCGWPAPESPLDYFCQMVFAYREFMGCKNWWEFRHKYFFNVFAHNWAPRKGSVLKIKSEIHKSAFVLTRKDAGIGSEKVYERRTVIETIKQKKLREEIERDFEFTTQDKRIVMTKHTIVQLQWLSRLAGGFSPEGEQLSIMKLRELVDLLKGELANESVVVWFKHNQELRKARGLLGLEGIPASFIVGRTPLEKRALRIRKFRRKDIRVLLLQIKCGKVGLDLSVADTAIYYSNRYDAEDRVQSEDRIIHPLKKAPVLYIDLVTKNTVDETVLQILREKKAVSRRFMAQVIKRRFPRGKKRLRSN